MMIKVCGMKVPDNITEVTKLKIDMIGFIFYHKSLRYIGNEVAGVEVTQQNGVARVGVFVNETTDTMRALAKQHQLDTLQLHGSESAEQCRELRQEGYRLIKAIAVSDVKDLLIAQSYQNSCDWLLFDTKTAAYGGSGSSFDWSILEQYNGDTPFLLSGGISPQNLNSLLQFSHPQWVGIDLNSGFESEPALKDIESLRSFIETINPLICPPYEPNKTVI